MIVASLRSSAMPRASASRLAGSMVTTAARRPIMAAAIAVAAAMVVFPTPPVPQHTRTLRSAARSPFDTKAMAAAVPDELVDSVHLIGPRDRIRDRLKAWKEAGAKGHVHTMQIGTPQPEALELLAEELL